MTSTLERDTAMGLFCIFSLGLFARAPGNQQMRNIGKKMNIRDDVGRDEAVTVTRPDLISPEPVTLRHWTRAAPCPCSTHSFPASRTLRLHGRRHPIPRTSTFRICAGPHRRPHPWIMGQRLVCTERNPRSTASRNRVWCPQRTTSLRMGRNSKSPNHT